MADLNFSVGMNSDGLISAATQANKALDGMNRTAANLARKLKEKEVLAQEGANALELYKIASANISKTEKERLLTMAKLNQQEAAARAAEQSRIDGIRELEEAWSREAAAEKRAAEQAAAAAQKQKTAIAQSVAAMQQEAAMLGKSSAAQKLHELRVQGATQAQLKQAAAAQAQIAAHQRLQKGASFAMPSVATGLIGGLGAAGIIRMSDEWTVFNNRLKLVTNSSEELATAQQGILNIALKTGQDLGNTAQVYQRLAANQAALKLNGQELLEVTETINKAIVVGGSTAEGASAALTQFGQAMASGVLRGEEFNSMMEQAPGLAQALAEGLGVGVGQLRNMANNGELTAQRVTQALQKASGSVNTQFAKMDLTIAQSATNFKTSLTKFIGGMGQTSSASKKMAQAIQWAANHVDLLATGLGVLVAMKVGAWAVAGAANLVQLGASMLLLASQSGAATGANAALATSINATGLRAALASFQVTGFSGSLAVLRTAAVATTSSLWTMLAPFAPFIAGAAAVTASVTALSAAFKAAKGEDASNWISDAVDDMLDSLGVLDKRTETLGSKLYDWLHPLDEANNKLSKTQTLINAATARIGYESVSAKLDGEKFSGSVSAYKADSMKLEDLQKSLSDTVIKYREQAETIGKSTFELEKMRLAAEKTALLEKKKQEFEQEFAKDKNRDELVRQSMAQAAAEIEKDFQAATRAIDEAERATRAQTEAQNAQTSALQRATQVQDGINGLQDELERIGKSAKELRLMDLQKAGATQAQLQQASSLLDAIAAKEKAFEANQNKLSSVGDSFQAAANGMNQAADKISGGESIITRRYNELMAKANAYNAERDLAMKGKKSTAQQVGESRASGDDRFDRVQLPSFPAKEFIAQMREGIKNANVQAIKAERERNEQLAQMYREIAENLNKKMQETLKEKQGDKNTEQQSQEYQVIQNLNNASASLDQAAKAINAATALPQNQAIQKAQEIGRVTLDLRQPDGKMLTGILFGNKEFLEKFKTASHQHIESYINQMHAALT